MVNKIIVATLKKAYGKDILSFQVNDSKSIDINLNSDDQQQLKELFFELIKLLFLNDIIFELSYEDGYDQNNIFSNVAVEYIKELSEEIKTVKKNLPQK